MRRAMRVAVRWLFVLIVALLVGSGWFAVMVWRHSRGSGPALRKSPHDIVQLLKEQRPQQPIATTEAQLQVPSHARNETDMPLKLPSDVSITVFAQGLGKPRVLAVDQLGTLLVSIPSQGRIVALPDLNRDGVADGIVSVVEGLNQPHGLAFRCGAVSDAASADVVSGKRALPGSEHCQLYIAESHQVAAWDYDAGSHHVSHQRSVVALPDGGNHFTRTILFALDGRLLVAVGSSCNVCVEKDWRRATVLAVDTDTGTAGVYSSGLRNAVFMVLQPITGDVWVTEMGRDLLGDDAPPDELNVLAEGQDYGWPYCYGKRMHDSVFDSRGLTRDFCEQTVPSHIDIPAHSAPLGLAFIPAGSAWPSAWGHDLLVAYHGSWNRSEPTGYKIVRYELDEQGRYLGVDSTQPTPEASAGTADSPQAEDFISGWLTSEGVLGRPVDILVQPDVDSTPPTPEASAGAAGSPQGVMYVSDDKAGVIYRLTVSNP